PPTSPRISSARWRESAPVSSVWPARRRDQNAIHPPELTELRQTEQEPHRSDHAGPHLPPSVLHRSRDPLGPFPRQDLDHRLDPIGIDLLLLLPTPELSDSEPEGGSGDAAAHGKGGDSLGPPDRRREPVFELLDLRVQALSGCLDLPYRLSRALAHSTSSFTVRTVSSGARGGAFIRRRPNSTAGPAIKAKPPATIKAASQAGKMRSSAAAAASARKTSMNRPNTPATAMAPTASRRAVIASRSSCLASSTSLRNRLEASAAMSFTSSMVDRGSFSCRAGLVGATMGSVRCSKGGFTSEHSLPD